MVGINKVKKLQFVIYVLLLLMLSSTFIVGQDINESFDFETLNYTIDVDKNIFAVGEPIAINNTIKNSGSEVIGIEVFDTSILSFDYILYTLNGRILEKSMNFYEKKERAIENADDPRKEILFPDEQYGIDILLNGYYEELEPGRYILEPVFYPLTNIGESYPSISGKKIQIQIVPIPYEAGAVSEESPTENEYEPLSPYDTIDFILNSRLMGDDEGFFAYFDLSRVINLYNDWNDRFEQVPKSKRDELLEEFKYYLIENFEPDMFDYEVVRSFREENDATVVADIYKGSENITYTSRYIFQLEKRNDYWIVVEYLIQNLGRED